MKEGPWRKPIPLWVDIMGLKWLWRVTVNPGHWKRAWNAFPVFAWKVYRSK
jgi:UDP-N-acetyl-D-mannosaminuronic acid transferase (WecB/TagA/CpsF family)